MFWGWNDFAIVLLPGGDRRSSLTPFFSMIDGPKKVVKTEESAAVAKRPVDIETGYSPELNLMIKGKECAKVGKGER